MRMKAGWLVLCALGLGCGSKWEFQDQDGDGISAAEGDCWDQSAGPEGSGLSGDDIHPDAAETWYDGIDQNCAGDDDFDADADGFVPEEYLGEETRGLPESGLLPGGDCWDAIEGPESVEYGGAEIFPGSADVWYDGVDQDCGSEDDFDADGDGFVPDAFVGDETIGKPGSGDLPGGDCWDDPDTTPAPMKVATGETSDGETVDWSQPKAKHVHPDAEDVWYDGVDQNCDGLDDFDQDEDGHLTAHYPDQTGSLAGNDCVDQADDLEGWLDDDYLDLLEEESPEVVAPDAIHPGAEDAWYDGVDSDCAGDNDCDADLDLYSSPGPVTSDCVETDDWTVLRPCCPDEGDEVDCDDEDPERKPDDTVEEIFFNGVDDNCDASDGDGDRDGDRYWDWHYEDQVAAYAAAHPELGEITPMEVPDGFENDCVDDPSDPNLTDPEVTADRIHPWLADLEYNGFDEGCEGNDDYDQDGDGFVYDHYWGLPTYPVEGSGELPPNDCDDRELLGALIYDGAPDTWYDGVDSDCAGNSDYDADGDGYVQDVHVGELTDPWDSDDEDLPDWEPLELLDGGDCEDREDYLETFGGTLFDGADIKPGAADVWYDGVDSDCDDRDDYDADEDEYVQDEHLGEPTHPIDTSGELDGGDCEDDADYSGLFGGTLFTSTDINPGASDFWYDGLDQNCDHEDDYDQDGDEYVQDVHVGYGSYPWDDLGVLPGGDCSDSRATFNPGESDDWYDGDDTDCDGRDDYDQDEDDYVQTIHYGLSTDPVDGTGALPPGDCDDEDDGFNPGEPDAWYDGDDTDCDGRDDYDQDEDGYVQDEHYELSTYPVSGTGELPGNDCDDENPDANPGVNEDCDTEGYDDNCDGELDLVDAEACDDFYMDADRDGFGDPTDVQCTCGPQGDYDSENNDDCEDERSDTYPGAAEAESSLCAKDSDDDGYGDSSPGTWDSGSDCDDGEETTYPAASETCDDVDSDCDGDLNDQNSDDCTVFYRDSDGDSYGHLSLSRCYCEATGSWTADTPTDCDDGNDDVYPGAAELELTGSCTKDADDDGYGDSSPGSGITPGTDCDDTTSSTYEGAPETCESGTPVDSDCDGTTNDEDAALCTDYYRDSDGDGYGHETISRCYCRVSGSYSTTDNTDCDDGVSSINPDADEYCDGVDNDCDDTTDEPDSEDASTWTTDGDGDGYGDPATAFDGCDPDDGRIEEDGTDCDDDDASSYPGGSEVCDEADNDCDGTVDEGVTSTWTPDTDGDGFGDDSVVAIDGCDPGGSYIEEDGTDCDDGDDTIYPEADEYCDGVDNNCDGTVDEDEAVDATSWYVDDDGDGYGDATDSLFGCDPGSGYVEDDTDCDDTDDAINPAAPDYLGDGNEDCDTYIDEDEVFDRVAAGEDVIVISELQIDPEGGEPGNEWFELYNGSDVIIDLTGWTFRYERLSGSGGRTFHITPGVELTLASEGYLLMCAKNGTLEGISSSDCDYFYSQEGYYGTSSDCGDASESNLRFRNGGDFRFFFGIHEDDCTTASLDDLTVVDEIVVESDWDIDEGESLELAVELVTGGEAEGENDLEDNWCQNDTDVYSSTGNSGTPGVANTCSVSDL